MSYALAPMDRMIGILTYVMLGMPLVFLGLGISNRAVPMLGMALFFSLLYLFVWFWMRPSRFDLDGPVLRIVFPWRRIEIPRADIKGTRAMTRAEFRAEHGFGARIGAGGLWGGFGLLWTKRRMFMLYVSRVDTMLVVERREGRWLLLTPEKMEDFAKALTPSSSEIAS